MANYPNVYRATLGGTATTSADTVQFGFDARHLRVQNRGSVEGYVNFRSSEDATTDDAALNNAAGLSIMEFSSIPPLAGVSFFSTSTTGAGSLNVVAIG